MIHSFFQYAALQAPEHSAVIQRVLAMQGKKYDRSLVHFLSRPEIDALLEAPDRASWSGRRDHAMLLVAVQTGLRVSELAGLRVQNVVRGTVRTSTASARAARNAARPCAKMPSLSSERGCVNAPPPRPSPSSPTRGEVSSVATASSTCSRSTCRLQRQLQRPNAHR